MKTILGIGAHFDDCAFGVPGILLQAVRKHYRVVILSIIGDYSNWPPTKGREKEFVAGVTEVCKERGVEMRFLTYASHKFDVNADTKAAVAKAVGDIKPDTAFILWEHDNHHDHSVASVLGKIALRHGGRVLNEDAFKSPREIYAFDNGPRHTVGFEPNTYVNVTDVWPEAMEWLGKLMALQRNVVYDAKAADSALQAKETLARYRGAACGAKYAEAVWSTTPRTQEIL